MPPPQYPTISAAKPHCVHAFGCRHHGLGFGAWGWKFWNVTAGWENKESATVDSEKTTPKP
jgi:hypothetical protein